MRTSQTAEKEPTGITADRMKWQPLREDHMCRKGVEYFREWVAAGMPRKES